MLKWFAQSKYSTETWGCVMALVNIIAGEKLIAAFTASYPGIPKLIKEGFSDVTVR
jgi:hypothetical protein